MVWEQYNYPRQSPLTGRATGRRQAPSPYAFRGPLASVGSRETPSSRSRSFPERVQIQAMEYAGRVMTAPAAAAERPLALVNYFTRGKPPAGLKPGQGYGPVHDVLGAVGRAGLPVGPTIGDIVGAIGEGMTRSWNLMPAFANSASARQLAAVYNLPDDTVMTPELLARRGVDMGASAEAPRTEGLPLIGMLGLTGRNQTVGEFKAQLVERNFNTVQDPETGEMVEISWEEVVKKINTKGDFGVDGSLMFGDKAVNDNVMVDMLARMATDPVNFALGLGLVGKGARGAGLIMRSAPWARPASARLTAGRSWGVGLLRDLQGQGVRSATRQAPTQAARAIVRGSLESATLKGLALALKAPRALIMPGASRLEREAFRRVTHGGVLAESLGRRYMRGTMRLQLGGVAVEYGSAGVEIGLQHHFGDDFLLTGWASDLHDATEAIMNDTPLSSNQVFVMGAAFGVPSVSLLRGDIRAIRAGTKAHMGPSGSPAIWASKSSLAGPEVKGRAREKAWIEERGGRERVNRLFMMMDRQAAAKKYIRENPETKWTVESLEEFIYGSDTYASLLDTMADDMRFAGEITDANRYAMFEDWGRNRRETRRDPETGDILETGAQSDFSGLTPSGMMQQWDEYARAMDQLHEIFGPLAGALLGRANRMDKPALDHLRNIIKMQTRDGQVSSELVIDALVHHQGMFDDPMVDGDFWRTLMNQGVAAGKEAYVGVGPGARVGAGPMTYDANLILSKLDDLYEKAPERRELWHEAAAAEHGAAGDPTVLRRGGILTRGGARRVLTAESARRIFKNSSPAAKANRHQLRRSRELFQKTWTHNKNLRGIAELTRRVPRMLAGGSFSRTGVRLNLKTGYAVGQIPGALGKFKPDDIAGITDAVQRVAAEFPDANIGTWVGDGLLWVEPSRVYATLGEAMDVARRLGQRTIWDNAAGKEISVGRGGNRPKGGYPAHPVRSLDDIRQSQQDDINRMQESLEQWRREMAEIRADTEQMRLVELDHTFLDKDGNPVVSGRMLTKLKAATLWTEAEFGGQYRLARGPRLQAPWAMSDGPLPALMQERSILASALFDYGPVSKVVNMLEWLGASVSSGKRARDSRQQIVNILMPLGARPAEMKTWMDSLVKDVEKDTLGLIGSHIWRGPTALLPSHVNRAFGEAFASNPEFVRRFVAKYGENKAHVVLDEAYNSLIRRIDLQVMRGEGGLKKRPFSTLFRSGYWAWGNWPVLSTVSAGTRTASRVLYPLFRFLADIRWQAMNVIEHDAIAVVQDGLGATRFNRGFVERSWNKGAMELHQRRSEAGGILPALRGEQGSILSPSAAEFRESMGAFLPNSLMMPVLKRQFQGRSLKEVDGILDSLPEGGTIQHLLVQRFGSERGTWSDQINQMLYQFDAFGVVESVRGTYTRLSKDWTAQERLVMQPFLSQIIKRNQQTFDSLLQFHIGNTNRSHMERILNSYWLYWPVSYQIKASKWLADTLFQRHNMAGAWTLDRAYNLFKEQLTTNAEFRQQLEDQQVLWFAAGMMIPITPFDMGVSLNRGVRYVGGNVLGWWPEYAGLDNAGDWASMMMKLGPIYTADLISRGIEAAFEEEEPTVDSASAIRPLGQ